MKGKDLGQCSQPLFQDWGHNDGINWSDLFLDFRTSIIRGPNHKSKLIHIRAFYGVSDNLNQGISIWTDFHNFVWILGLKLPSIAKKSKKIQTDNMNGKWRYQRERKSLWNAHSFKLRDFNVQVWHCWRFVWQSVS